MNFPRGSWKLNPWAFFGAVKPNNSWRIRSKQNNLWAQSISTHQTKRSDRYSEMDWATMCPDFNETTHGNRTSGMIYGWIFCLCLRAMTTLPTIMGYLVLQPSDGKRFEIIDGQQRLTTISLIVLSGLSYLKDLVKSGQDPQNNKSRAEQLQRNHIGYVDPITLVSRPKLELNRHSNRFHQNHLVPLEYLPQRNPNSS